MSKCRSMYEDNYNIYIFIYILTKIVKKDYYMFFDSFFLGIYVFRLKYK